MRKRVFLVALLVPFVLTGVALAASRLEAVKPGEYDPAKTYLVQAAWLNGIGCPTAASTAAYPDTKPNGTYTDPACGTGDPKDKRNEGLLLVKTGPTTNNAAAIAELKGVKGTVLTELGYDIRKPGTELAAGARGSTGAPARHASTSRRRMAASSSSAATLRRRMCRWLARDGCVSAGATQPARGCGLTRPLAC